MKRLALVVAIMLAVAGCQPQRSNMKTVAELNEVYMPVQYPAAELSAADRAQILRDAPGWIERRARVTVRFLEEPAIWCERVGGKDCATLNGPVAAYTVYGSWVRRDVTLHVERHSWGFDLPAGDAVTLFP